MLIGVDYPADRSGRIRINDEIAHSSALEADFTKRGDKRFNRYVMISIMARLQAAAPLRAGFIDEWIYGRAKEVAIDHREDQGDVSAFAQVAVTAGHGQTANQLRTKGLP